MEKEDVNVNEEDFVEDIVIDPSIDQSFENHVNDAIRSKVPQFLEMVKTADLIPTLEKIRCTESMEALLQRFLKARSGDVNLAFKFLKEDCEWREANQILSLRTKSMDDMLVAGRNPILKETIVSMIPQGCLGRDKQGRPILYRKVTGNMNVQKLAELGYSVEEFLIYQAWMLERTVAMMNDKGQWISIMDLGELNLTKMMGNLNIVKAFTALAKNHFPERLAHNIIINAPTVFGIVWRAVQVWLDKETQKKVSIFSSPKNWKPALEKEMDLNLLPTESGGPAHLSYSPSSFDP
mmetsp:Transcript_26681/g.87509  ORF Transcript_26681/g.87509 Transcript_26681/m.87509 type:complete len:294 (-) Transcript_26681:31-912(-)